MLLGIYIHLADIIDYFENKNGLILHGYLGVTPLAISNYFNQSEFSDINVNFTNGLLQVDDMIRNSDVSIVNYIHSQGMHYIAVGYDAGRNEFYTVNNTQGNNALQWEPSMDEWFLNRKDTVVNIITLSR